MSTTEATNPAAPQAQEGVAPETPATELPQVETTAEEQPDGQAPAQLDDTEETEYEGKKYKLPRELVPALMRQADYTKKTQEAAAEKKAAAEERARLADQAKAVQEDLAIHAQGYALHQELQGYEKVDWNALKESDFMLYTQHRDRVQDLRYQLGQITGQLQAKQAQRASQATAQAAQLREQTRQTLAKEIPNWSPKREQELTEYAVKSGYKAEEVKAALDTDARPFKFLHKAFLWDQHVAKTLAAVKAQPNAEPVKPVGTGRAAPIGLSDSLSTAEWVKRRNAQLQRKA